MSMGVPPVIIRLPTSCFSASSGDHFDPEIRLIRKLLMVSHSAANQAKTAFNSDNKTEMKLLSTIKTKVQDFITALKKICEEQFNDGLSLELVTSHGTDSSRKTNIIDRWSTAESRYWIWLDTIFGLVLKKDNQPIALLGLDLDYDYSAKVPARFTMNIEQIQGLNTYDENDQVIKRNLKGFDFTKFFMECCMKLRKELNILRLGIIQSHATPYYLRALRMAGDDKQMQRDIKLKLFKRYDQTALDRHWNLDEKSKRYFKYF